MSIDSMIRVAIVDDNQVLREGLRLILNAEKDMEVVREAEDGFGAIEIAQQAGADVLILEPLIPKKDAIDVTKDVIGLDRNLKVLILTTEKTTHNAFRLLRAGATGWLSKMAGSAEVIKAIRALHRGKVFLPKELQSLFAEKYVQPEAIKGPEDVLSDREFQVMRLLAQGNTNREISKLLFIGVKTVDTHRANLLRKLNLRNNSDITRFAIQNGFISI